MKASYKQQQNCKMTNLPFKPNKKQQKFDRKNNQESWLLDKELRGFCKQNKIAYPKNISDELLEKINEKSNSINFDNYTFGDRLNYPNVSKKLLFILTLMYLIQGVNATTNIDNLQEKALEELKKNKDPIASLRSMQENATKHVGLFIKNSETFCANGGPEGIDRSKKYIILYGARVKKINNGGIDIDQCSLFSQYPSLAEIKSTESFTKRYNNKTNTYEFTNDDLMLKAQKGELILSIDQKYLFENLSEIEKVTVTIDNEIIIKDYTNFGQKTGTVDLIVHLTMIDGTIFEKNVSIKYDNNIFLSDPLIAQHIMQLVAKSPVNECLSLEVEYDKSLVKCIEPVEAKTNNNTSNATVTPNNTVIDKANSTKDNVNIEEKVNSTTSITHDQTVQNSYNNYKEKEEEASFIEKNKGAIAGVASGVGALIGLAVGCAIRLYYKKQTNVHNM